MRRIVQSGIVAFAVVGTMAGGWFASGVLAGRDQDYCASNYQPTPGDGLTIKGTVGPDLLLGTEGPDIIYGYGGDDEICGFGGNDLILGGTGDDTLYGGPGDDVLRGGSGEDYVSDIFGWNDLYGESDRDYVVGSGRLFGGTNADDVVAAYMETDMPSILDGGSGDDGLYGSFVAGETLLGGSGSDFADGRSGDDVINCGSGNDQYVERAGDAETNCEVSLKP